jgi:hypothetical protein
MVERQFSKLLTRVRFPPPAPFIIKHLRRSAGKMQESGVQKIFFVAELRTWLLSKHRGAVMTKNFRLATMLAKEDFVPSLANFIRIFKVKIYFFGFIRIGQAPNFCSLLTPYNI